MKVYSGFIEISDLQLKRTLFEDRNTPLTMVFGRIGYLKIVVPWSHLSSQACTLEMREVYMVVCPKGKHEWNTNYPSQNTDFRMREQFILKQLTSAFQDLIVSGDLE